MAPEAPPAPPPLKLAPDADDGGSECLRDEDEPQPPVMVIAKDNIAENFAYIYL